MKSPFSRWIKKYLKSRREKIFCISFQRTGTTSTGKFFQDHGFKVAGWNKSRENDWTLKWFSGDYDSIFDSHDFKINEVYEDDPWWCQDFYKVLFHKFPDARFVLMERDSDKWFDSMVLHSKGKSLGNTYRHSRIYHREAEFDRLGVEKKYSRDIDNLLPLNESNREHYKIIYELRNREVKEFFAEFDSKRLFNCDLDQNDKWIQLGKFACFDVDEKYEVHENKSLQKNDSGN